MSNPPYALSPLEKKSSISACIISFNEERNIGECIDSVAWCDEVVVVDSFSEDRTAEIARDGSRRNSRKPLLTS